MIYEGGNAFRRALEDRLKAQSIETGLPLTRLRKMVAFDRFLARLMHDQSERWLLKGGLALQLHLGNRARTTRDIDVHLAGTVDDLHETLVRAALLELGDWFHFAVADAAGRRPNHLGGNLRFSVEALLDGRRFETFHLDVGWGDPVTQPPELRTMPPLLAFAGIAPTALPCYPIVQHIAEKVHAYTLPHLAAQSSRVKDLVDILLMAEAETVSDADLWRAICATFEVKATHPMPASLPDPPTTWAVPFRKLAKEVSLDYESLADAIAAARCFLDPVLDKSAKGRWNPSVRSWS